MKIPNRKALKCFSLLWIAVLAALCLSAGTAFAEPYSDTDGHWGAAVIDKWGAYDVLQGDGDGSFAPNRDMSVAELATVLSKAFGYTEVGNPSISSAIPSWAQEDVKKAVTAGVIASDETGLTLTRELSAKILAKALKIAPLAGATAFRDDGAVSAAYRPYVNALGREGAFKGDTAGNFMPQKGFTRAEVMQVFENTLTDIVRESKAAASEKSIIVNAPNLSLTAGTVEGDLIIGQGVGDGDITLTDVKIAGRLIVYGGGKNSIYIKGESAVPLVVTQKTFGAPARIVVDAAASVGTVSVVAESAAVVTGDVAKLEIVPASEVTVSGEIASAAPAHETSVEVVSGTVAEISIEAEGASLALGSGATVTSLVVSGANAEVTVASGATVAEATVAASDVAIEGAGKVESVTVTADSAGGVSVTVPGTQVQNESDAAVSAGADKTVDAGKSDSVATAPSGGGGGGGGGGSDTTTVSVTDVTLNETSATIEVNNTVTLTATVSPENATTKTVTWSSSNTAVATVDTNGTVTGVTPGTATITVTTDSGEKTATASITVTAAVKAPALSKEVSLAYASDKTATLSFTYDSALAAIEDGDVLLDSAASDAVTATLSEKVISAKVDMAGLTPGTDYIVSVKAKAAADTSKAVTSSFTFKAVSGEFTRAANAGTYKIAYADAAGVIRLTDENGDAAWYFAQTDGDLYKIFDAVYTPNADVTDSAGNKAVDLFFVTLGADSNGDKIELKGTAIPSGESSANPAEIQIGIPNADNTSLPDFIIPAGALGGTNNESYSTTRIVVNEGAYLNIDSDQTWASVYGTENKTPTPGQFRNGNITVKSGGKLRDSAYKFWPLGSGSTLSVLEGGFLAVGKGDRNGDWADAAVDAQTGDIAKEYYGGWLIGDSTAKIYLGGGGTTESFNDAIEICDSLVMLNGYAIVQKDISLMYDVLVTRGSALEIADGKEIMMLSGKAGGAIIGSTYDFYGQPSGASPSFTTPNTSIPSQIVLKPGASIVGSSLGTANSLLNSGGSDMSLTVSSTSVSINGGWPAAGSFFIFIESTSGSGE
jgi:uncharacterized protein YjdB